MLFRFRLEKLQNLVRHFVVGRQGVKVRACCSCGSGLFSRFGGKLPARFRLRIVQRRWFRRERKAIAFFEGRDVLKIFFGGIADFQKIVCKQRNSVGEEFRQRPMLVAAERRIQ